MDILIWVVLFLVSSLFWGWVLFLGGADWLEGSLLSGLLVHFRAPAWTGDGIKVFAAVVWLAHGVRFVAGLFSPEVRQFIL